MTTKDLPNFTYFMQYLLKIHQKNGRGRDINFVILQNYSVTSLVEEISHAFFDALLRIYLINVSIVVCLCHFTYFFKRSPPMSVKKPKTFYLFKYSNFIHILVFPSNILCNNNELFQNNQILVNYLDYYFDKWYTYIETFVWKTKLSFSRNAL